MQAPSSAQCSQDVYSLRCSRSQQCRTHIAMPILQSPGGLWSFEACNCFSKFQIKLLKLMKFIPNFSKGNTPWDEWDEWDDRPTGPKGPHRPRWMHLVWRSATMPCSAKISMLFSDRCVLVPLLDLKCYLDASETADRNRQFLFCQGFFGDLVLWGISPELSRSQEVLQAILK